jgi:hypothetical protein
MLNASGALILRALHHAAAVGLNDKLYVISGFVEGWTPTEASHQREILHIAFACDTLFQAGASARCSPDCLLGKTKPLRAAARKRRYLPSLARSATPKKSNARYITPPYGLRANGPLMMGACLGAAREAGIRF